MSIGEEVLGKAPGPFAIEARAGDRRPLSVRAPGYAARTVDSELLDDADIRINLSPVKANVHRDLAEPDF